MSYDNNIQTLNALSSDITFVKKRCFEDIHEIVNAPCNSGISPENVQNKTLSYVEGLQKEIQNSNVVINTNDNLLTSQFLSDVKERTRQLEELCAFTKGAISDVDLEIIRLTEQIRISQEVKSRPAQQKRQVTEQHIQKAKERFQYIKEELHSLISSLFPDNMEEMKEILGALMATKMNETSNEYIPITVENYPLIELLKVRKIVSINPYNDAEVKLAY